LSRYQKDVTELRKLCAAINNLTGAIYEEWSDLSERHLSTDDLNRLAGDVRACIFQMRQLSIRLEAKGASSN